ncbi:MAG: CpXC domain-containing protein, partial [Myxococcota bacterium]
MSHSIHSFNTPERSAAGHSNPYTGVLGKTQRSSVMVSGAGGHAFAAEVYTQANVTSEPALRQGLLDGSLNTVVDPRSGKRYALAIPVLYHDERLKLFALFLPDALRHQEFQQRRALLERLEALDEPLPAYVRRFFVVFGRMDLEQAEEQCRRVADPRPSTSNEDLNVRIRELDAKEEQLKRERQELSTLRLKLEDQAMRLKEAEAAAQNVLKAHTVEPEVTSRRERVAVEPQVPMVRVSTTAASAMAPPIFEPDTLVPELIPEEPAPTKRETTMVVSMDMFYTDEGEPLNAIVVDKHSSEDGRC